MIILSAFTGKIPTRLLTYEFNPKNSLQLDSKKCLLLIFET